MNRRQHLHRLVASTAALLALLAGAAAGSVPANAATSSRSPVCRAAQLRGAFISDGGGAAGSFEGAIRLTNTGSRACTLQGWPGVSFVGHGDGTQIGAAAVQDRRSLHPTVTLLAHRSVKAPLRIVQALNYPTSTCRPVKADGFRVYPPASRAAIFVKTTGLTGCASTRVHLLTISALRPLR